MFRLERIAERRKCKGRAAQLLVGRAGKNQTGPQFRDKGL